MSHSSALLKGQTALVTGSSSGIGEAAARNLAKAGASVVINYNSDPKQAEEIVGDIRSQGGKAIAVGANVAKEEDVLSLFAQTYQEFGTVDILVALLNAAMICPHPQPFSQMEKGARTPVPSPFGRGLG